MLSDDICSAEIPPKQVYFRCDQIQIHNGCMT